MKSKPAEFSECQTSNSNDIASKEGSSRELFSNIFGEGENVEFSAQERLELKVALKNQAKELDNLISSAQSGDKSALQRLQSQYGPNVDLDTLSADMSKISDAARDFKSWNFRKLKTNNSLYGSSENPPRAYHIPERVGVHHVSRIYLSKTAYNDIISGSSGQYTGLHEVAHSVGYKHNFEDRSFDFQQVLCKRDC